MTKHTTEEIAHIWQEFRIRCLELALKAGATTENVVSEADKLGTYIMTKSEREIAATKASSGDQ